MSDSPIQFTFKVPKGYRPDDLRDIGDDVVQLIRDRSQLGFGVRKRGKGYTLYDFPEYTPEYEKFKGQRKVDLTLSEDMLNGLSVLEVDEEAGTVTVGYDEGDDQAGKVEGNTTGSYGKPRPNPRKARNFLGVTRDELEAVLAVYEKGGG